MRYLQILLPKHRKLPYTKVSLEEKDEKKSFNPYRLYRSSHMVISKISQMFKAMIDLNMKHTLILLSKCSTRIKCGRGFTDFQYTAKGLGLLLYFKFTHTKFQKHVIGVQIGAYTTWEDDIDDAMAVTGSKSSRCEFFHLLPHDLRSVSNFLQSESHLESYQVVKVSNISLLTAFLQMFRPKCLNIIECRWCFIKFNSTVKTMGPNNCDMK